ncbi:MAG: radical SAM protein [Spirochaetaceae bacterium]
MKIKNIRALGRVLMFNRIKTNIFFHYFPYLFKKKLDLRHYALLIKRINLFLKSLKLNKIYKIGFLVKIDQAVPYYGSEVFYKYMDRFLNFDGKLACSSVLLSVSKDCSFNCKHCYQKHDNGDDLDLESLLNVTKELIDQGVTNYTIEGGDPFINFDRLKSVCETIGKKGDIAINSTGDGITLERLKSLKDSSNVRSIIFSINSPIKEDVNFFMGQDYAWNTLIHGLKLCSIGSIPTSLNCCLNSDHYENGNFEYLMEIAKDFGVAHVKLIHPKAAGAWLQGSFPSFTDEELQHIKLLVKKYNKQSKYRKYPSITAQVIEEDKEHYGCAAGGTDRFYINGKGDVQPCEFLNVSFGNIKEEKFSDIFDRMRTQFETPGVDWLCEKYSQNIDATFKTEGSLPLSVESSNLLYRKWGRGEATPLFHKIEKELV